MKQKKLILNFFVNRNWKKLSDGRKRTKILADNRKSHHPIETLFTFHLQYKQSGTFDNRKYEQLSYPKKFENVRPHSSSSIENVTPL